jgi:hypothetical protein
MIASLSTPVFVSGLDQRMDQVGRELETALRRDIL